MSSLESDPLALHAGPSPLLCVTPAPSLPGGRRGGVSGLKMLALLQGPVDTPSLNRRPLQKGVCSHPGPRGLGRPHPLRLLTHGSWGNEIYNLD